LLAASGAVEGDWLVALEQEAGRGRQGRAWVGASGNFFGSTLVELVPSDPPAPTLSMAAGVALIRAVEAAAPATGLILKWPNDLMMGHAKLGGILLERSGSRLVAGFGVNLARAPELPDRETGSLASVALVTPQGFAPLLAGAFARALDLWRSDQPRLMSSWFESAHPIGTPLPVHAGPGETAQGEFAGIDLDGALRLRLADGSTRVIHAADVSLV
jgi:BirA family transcriptional regulator, biotin operon repressor / biotin---[acetyl-CoA-carboxylase] ligase